MRPPPPPPPPHPPPPSSSPGQPCPSEKWSPYSNSRELNANMGFIFILILCAIGLTFLVHAAIHFILRRYHHHRMSSTNLKSLHNNEVSITSAPPTLFFSSETKLTAGEVECAICLAEFNAGDGLRVLPACGHGFHVTCIDAWLSTTLSCPTCRAIAQPPNINNVSDDQLQN